MNNTKDQMKSQSLTGGNRKGKTKRTKMVRPSMVSLCGGRGGLGCDWLPPTYSLSGCVSLSLAGGFFDGFELLSSLPQCGIFCVIVMQ